MESNGKEVIMNCLIISEQKPHEKLQIQNCEPISPSLINPTVLASLVHYIC